MNFAFVVCVCAGPWSRPVPAASPPAVSSTFGVDHVVRAYSCACACVFAVACVVVFVGVCLCCDCRLTDRRAAPVRLVRRSGRGGRGRTRCVGCYAACVI